jgi:SAM-dependent methyltransferase
MDMSRFDQRNYRTVSVTEGYRRWVPSYEGTVLDLMDIRLLDRLTTVEWASVRDVADLGCGTGRIGVWMRDRGVGAIDGVDLTPEMLDLAREKDVYRTLEVADVSSTGLDSDRYDVVTSGLVDEHLPGLDPIYGEAARIARPGGKFVIVGYHPFFLMGGIPTHFDDPDGEPVAIQCYVHLFSDHVRAATRAGWRLFEMDEGVIDDAWVSQKPKWDRYRDRPISFAFVWELTGSPSRTSEQSRRRG